MSDIARPATAHPKSSIIPWLFVSFFGIVFVVNGIMVWLAVTTFSGLETEDAFARGLNYNETLAAEARQEALGWQAELKLARERIEVELRDQDGTLLMPERIVARLIRPSDSALDRLVVLELDGTGHHALNIASLQPGLWEVQMQIDRGDERFFTAERVFVQ